MRKSHNHSPLSVQQVFTPTFPHCIRPVGASPNFSNFQQILLRPEHHRVRRLQLLHPGDQHLPLLRHPGRRRRTLHYHLHAAEAEVGFAKKVKFGTKYKTGMLRVLSF